MGNASGSSGGFILTEVLKREREEGSLKMTWVFLQRMLVVGSLASNDRNCEDSVTHRSFNFYLQRINKKLEMWHDANYIVHLTDVLG